MTALPATTRHRTDEGLRHDLYSPGREVNVALLRKAVEWVEEQDALPTSHVDGGWRQASWVSDLSLVTGGETCGTAYCVAGYVGQLLDPAYKDSEWGSGAEDGVHVADYAQERLGLNFHQREALFAAGNSAADVRRIAEAIVGESL